MGLIEGEAGGPLFSEAAGAAVPIPAVAELSSAVGSARSAVESTDPHGCSDRAPNGGRGRNDERCEAAVARAFPVGAPDTPGQAELVGAWASAAVAVERCRKTN